MASVEDRLKALETQMRRALATTASLQGQPSDATLSIPHNDSWLFEDNVDGPGGFAGNLRYVISSNVQRVVSARLSIHLAPYRTYNSLTLTATGTESALHNHGHTHTGPSHTHTGPSHNHAMQIAGGVAGNALTINVGGPMIDTTGGPYNDSTTMANGGTGASGSSGTGATGSDSTTESATHTHNVTGSTILGVTEGTVASGVSISFDGVDQTVALGGPFSVDQIELNVLPYLATTKDLWHTIAMLPSGLGRIEAHLRLGVYVAAGSAF